MRLATSVMPLALAGLSGCSHLSVDADGTRHIVGLVVLTLPPAKADVAADSLRMRSLGLTITQGTRLGGSLVLGYSDATLAALRQDALVPRELLFDPAAAAPAASQPRSKE
jgi:hypothetical protein